MAEVDPVVLQLRADIAQYRAQLNSTTAQVEKLLDRQGASARKLETEMKRSSGAIGSTLKGLAATLATAFTGRELVGLIDGFTRLQNSLKVAGLEGDQLLEVQKALQEQGGRYGVDINTLADLYGNLSQSGKELGATQASILQVSEAVSRALIITGKSSAQAQGAVLGLVQAFGNGKLQAEEYAQINEGGLRPLLEAAAATEKYGGSIQKLRTAVYAGKVSSQEFYDAILAGSGVLESKASNAALTLGGAFTALSNELTLYVGGAASASGATGLIADAIKALADNLDVLIPALATIAVAMGVRTVAGAVAASRAMFALQAAMLGAATTAEALKFALAGLKGALPIIAITALLGGMIYLAQRSNEATKATGAYAVAQREAANASSRASELAQKLATAHGKVRAEALAAARAEAENTKQKLAGARASLVLAQAELKKAQAFQAAQNVGSVGGGVAGTATFIQGTGDTRAAQARGNVDAALGNIKSLEASLKTVQDAIAGATAPAVANVTAGAGKKGGASGAGPTGPSAAEIANRFYDELASYRSQAVAAEAQIARNANERAELELVQVETARNAALRGIRNDADYSKAQKEALELSLEGLVDRERAAVEFRRTAELERDAQDLADERYQAEQEQLRLQLDLADTQSQRRAIAFQILAAEDEYLRSKLEAVLASQTATDAEKERARIALEAMNATAGAREDGVAKQYQSALGRYADNAKDADARIAEAAAQRIADLNDTIADAMTDALGIKDPFLSELIKIFLDRNIFGPLAEALDAQKGGGIGGLVSAIGSLFGGGRASGGRVDAGTLYRVNEGASPGRVEGFVPDVGGQIIPLGRMNAARPAAAGGGTSVVRLELSGDIDARIQSVSGPVAIEVVKASQPALTRAAVAETFKEANRSRI